MRTLAVSYFVAAYLCLPNLATVQSLSMSHIDRKLKELGITIRDPPAPKGNYVSCVRTGNLLHLCGHIPQKDDGTLICGRLGQDLTVEQGYESARVCAMNILNTLHKELDGDLSRVARIVKLVGFVNSASDFHQQPAVINGASDLFGEVFGSAGLHARSAVGSNVLPLGIATEVEAIVEIRDI
jgi:enamine deaminase RidA (YjgF/YER057c/UK114 family)